MKNPKKHKTVWQFTLDAKALEEITKQLASPNKSKDPLLKALKGLRTELEEAPQDVECLKTLGPTIASSLLQCSEHSDKDVKLMSCHCLTHMLRIYAPETPFTDDELKDVFRALLWALAKLDNPSAPAFSISQSILQLTEQVKFHLLLLDLDAPDILTEFFEVLLGCARDDSVDDLEHPIVEILSGLLEAAEDDVGDILSDPVLSALLQAMLGRLGSSGSTKEIAAQSRVAGELVLRSEDIIRPHLQRYLTCLISTGGGTDEMLAEAEGAKGVSAAQEHIEATHKGGKINHAEKAAAARRNNYKAILKIFGVAPQVLLPVLPHIGAELDAEEEGRRKDAVYVVIKLLEAPTSDFADQYPGILERFMKRYVDHRVDIRLIMLNHSVSLASSAPTEQLRLQVLNGTAGRLQDPADSVRVAACRVVCELAAADLSHASLNVLEAVGRRLRDTSKTVRNEAATGLMTVFRSFAVHVGKHGFSDSMDPLALWIPGRLVWTSLHNISLRSHLMASLSSPQGGLFPAGLDSRTCAKIWVVVYDQASDLEKEALLRLVSMKCKTQAALQGWLSVRSKLKSKTEEQNRDSLERCMERLMLSVLDCCPHEDKAVGRDLMSKLYLVKDLKVFERLATVCDLSLNERQAREAKKDLLERLGSKTAMAEYISSLLDMVRPTLLSSQQLKVMTGMLLPLSLQHSESTAKELGAAPTEKVAAQAKGKGKSAKSKTPCDDVEPADELEQGLEREQGFISALLPALCKLLSGCSKAAAALLAPNATHLAELINKSHSLTSIMKEHAQHSVDSLAATNAKGKSKKGNKGVSEDPIEALDTDGGRTSHSAVMETQAFSALVKALSRCIKLSDTSLWQDAGVNQKLVTCMEEICTIGPAEAAKWAPAVLLHSSAIPARPSGTPKPYDLRGLSKRLKQQLVPSSVCDLTTHAAIQGLCSVGWMAPDALGDASGTLVDFVVHNFLTADIHSSSGSRQEPVASDASGQWGAPSAGVAAKMSAIKAVSRALCPMDGATPLPAAFVTAVDPLVRALERLVDVENDIEDVGAFTEFEKGHVRLAAANALLRLGTRHDSRIPPAVWVSLSLTMQDPLTEVRAAFGSKLSRYVLSLLQLSSAGRMPRGAPAWLVTKYAAMLPLAAMDPTAPNLEAAARQLREFATMKRHHAQVQQQQEAQKEALSPREGFGGESSKRSGGHTGFPLHPEFILPFTIYLLSHHPDVPEFGPAADAESLQPFSIMLQLCLEPLLAPSPGMAKQQGKGGGAGKAGITKHPAPAGTHASAASLPMILKALRHMRVMADGDKEQQATEQMRGLCDLATDVALSISRRWARKQAAPTAKGGQRTKAPQLSRGEQLASIAPYPGSIVLPKSLYQASPGDGDGARSESLLPLDFHPHLDSSIRAAGCRVPMPPGMREDQKEDDGAKDSDDDDSRDDCNLGSGHSAMEVDSAHPAGGQKQGTAGKRSGSAEEDPQPQKKKAVQAGGGGAAPQQRAPTPKKDKGRKQAAKKGKPGVGATAPARANNPRAGKRHAQTVGANESSDNFSDEE